MGYVDEVETKIRVSLGWGAGKPNNPGMMIEVS
jgi:hypothetical protein